MARITPKPEHFDSARNAIHQIIEATRRETGCLQFILHESEGGDSLHLYEEWQDAAALDAHYEQPYTKEVFANYASWLAEPVEIHRMKRLA